MLSLPQAQRIDKCLASGFKKERLVNSQGTSKLRDSLVVAFSSLVGLHVIWQAADHAMLVWNNRTQNDWAIFV